MLRLALTPRWLLRHLLLLVAVVGCLVAARWQLHRALTRHSILNASYVLEWSLFAGFAVLCWAWFLRDEARGPQPERAPAVVVEPALPAARQAAPAPGADEDDPELAAYNAHLAALAARTGQQPRP